MVEAFRSFSLLALGIVVVSVVIYIVWGLRKMTDPPSDNDDPYSSIDL